MIKLFELFFQLLETLFRFLFEFAETIFFALPKKKQEYSASFASMSSLLSSSNTGYNITGDKNLSLKASYEGCMVVSPTGGGKSSCVLFPTLFSTEGSFIIHDPSSELGNSAGYLSTKRNYKIRYLNYCNPSLSSNYNPLMRIKNMSDAQKMASLLVTTSLKTKGDDFWNSQAVMLLNVVIRIVLKQEPKYRNFYNVRHIITAMSGDPASVDELFARDADTVLYNEYRSIVGMTDKTLSSVISTAKSALTIFGDPHVAQVTSSDNIDFEEFRTNKVALFIQNSVADQKYYSVLTSLFFEQLFSHLLEKFPDKNHQDVFLLLDECSSLYLPTLSLAMANMRKYRASGLILLQSYSQLEHLYGKESAEAIRENCKSKLYFPGLGLDTSRELSESLGKYTYTDEKDKSKHVRPLLTHDEIRMLPKDRAILLASNHPPIQVKLVPHYTNRRFRGFADIPAPAIENTVYDELPLLPLNSSDSNE